MRIERINTWLGFSGNIAILLGLVLLAIEINGNTEAVRAQELANINSINRQRQLLMASEPEMQEMYVKSLYNYSELTLSELFGVVSLLSMRIDHLRDTYKAFQNGTITSTDWEAVLGMVPIYLGGKFGRVFWDTVKNDYASESKFVAAVENILVNSKIVPDDEWLLNLQERVIEAGL